MAARDMAIEAPAPVAGGIIGFAVGAAVGAAIGQADSQSVYVAPPVYAPPPVYVAPPPVYYAEPPVVLAPVPQPQTTIVQPFSPQQQAIESCLEKNDDVRRKFLQNYGYPADERYLPNCAPGMN